MVLDEYASRALHVAVGSGCDGRMSLTLALLLPPSLASTRPGTLILFDLQSILTEIFSRSIAAAQVTDADAPDSSAAEATARHAAAVAAADAEPDADAQGAANAAELETRRGPPRFFKNRHGHVQPCVSGLRHHHVHVSL